MNWIFTSAYCKANMLKEGLEHIYSKPKNTEGFKHVIIDQHYPVEKCLNRKRIQELCEVYNCIYIDSLYDRGLHKGLNNAMKLLDVQLGDIFIGCDPDDRPSHGAFHALREIMLADSSVAVAALNFWVLPWKQKDQNLVMRESIIGGHGVWEHPAVEMFNVAAFNMSLLTGMGGFSQPNAYYGGIEIALYQQWVRRHMKMVYLRDHNSEAAAVNREDPLIYDKSYGLWKIDHAHKGYPRSYEEWLLEKGQS